MASENDPTTALDAAAADSEQARGEQALADAPVEAAPAEKPKRRRATKKAAAPKADAPAPEVPPSDATEAAPADRTAESAAGSDDAPAAPAKKAPRKRAAKKTTKAKAKSAPQAPAEQPVVEEPAEGAPPVEAVAADVDPTQEPGEPAPEEAVEEPQDEAPVEEAVAAPAVPSFGLLFQAPEPVAPRRRRATSPAQAPVERPVVEEGPAAGPAATEDEGSATQAAPVDETVAQDSDRTTDDRTTDDRTTDDGESGGRSRRRRGGRGRRGRSQADDDQAGTASADTAVEGEEAGGTGPADTADDTDSDAGSSRRRRRRRRGGSSGEAEGEDPPGTVTRVREPRSQREEPTAVKGSTRLEAKKQRRREGREAGRRRTIITEAEFLARRESVERVMVVRGRGDRTQIGVLEDGVLVEHYVSRETTASMAGNVYLGRVQNVLPSMEAAFVDIGKGRNAVLYAGEVNWDAAGLEGGQARRIENALSSGDTVLVQVTKDPIGHKGARLTSQISLPGRYLVYVPEGQMTGISRKLPDTERARLKAILKEVVPDSAGVIVRTAAEGASEEELRADVERLTKIWDKIQDKAKSAGAKKAGSGGAPALLHGEPDLTVRVIRDVFTEDFTSLVVSGDKAWSEVSQYVEDVAPDLAPRLQRWTAEDDVFAAHRIDESLAKAMDRKVWLPSGGSLVIDRTEAMTVVDVNTGKFVGSGGNLEETVTKNNLEAAEEIVRQLRLRDIGGIIVIDFIDMVLESNRDLVVRRLLECLGRDRTKHQVAEVTSLGLVQMTRKRVGSGLVEVFSEPCEHCAGRGIVVHTEPIERGGSSDQGGSTAQGGSRSGRGRRGTAVSGSSGPGGSGAAGSGNGHGPGDEVRTPSGPTAAQIAAAAHAAAMRKAEAGADAGHAVAPDGSGEHADVQQGAEQPEAAGAPAASEAGGMPESSDAVLVSESSDAGSAPESSDAVSAPESSDAASAPESPDAGSAPAQPDAPAAEDGAPRASGLRAAVAEVASAVADAFTAPEPAAAPRGRRKRGRVVAPAGPPRGAQPEASRPEQ